MLKSAKFPKNRLYRGDCLEVMQQLHGEGIAPDLIYLDPPFNSNRNYNIIFKGGGKGAQQTAFSDMWQKQYNEETERDISAIAADIGTDGRLIKLLKSWADILGEGSAHEKSLFNYLLYMTRRLVWCHKILPPHGSIYLHCDPTASHYLKIIMDLIFGKENFLNELVWHYAKIGVATYKWTANTDHILFWAKSHDYFFDYQVSGDPNEIYNRFAKLVRGNKLYYRELKLRHDSITKSKFSVAEKRLGRSLQDGDVVIDFDAKENKKRMDNVWRISSLKGNSEEYMGYPTQKPLGLLENIVNASSKGNDLVFDPFCGCGTTIHAAHKLGRKWIGADISPDAVKQIKIRARKHMSLQAEKHYELIECGAQTRIEYERLTPFEKQEWLVRQVGGVCGPKGGDGGVDGVIRYHIGGDKWDFGEFIISVKTGKQANPNMLDSLKGVMQKRGAKMGGLILDREPTSGMLDIAKKSPKIKYKMKIMGEMQQISVHLSVQILTADQILAGETFSTPPTLMDKKMAAK